MPRRGFRILFAVLWFVWTGIVIPGHTRGVLPISSSGCCEPTAKTCCDDKPGSSEPSKKSASNPQNCAICNLAVKLTSGPAMSVAPVCLGLVSVLPPPHAQTPVLPDSVLPKPCRDPPTA